jgi:hypothetical protein
MIRALPWHASRKGHFINDLNNHAVAEMCDSASKQDDAQFIAQAVNSHAALVQALQTLIEQINDYERVNNLAPNPGRTECWDTVARAKALLASLALTSNHQTPKRE